MATGEYITFVDGDDWVDADYISYFVHMLEKSKCDIAMNKNNYTETQRITGDKCNIIKSEKVIEWIYMGEIFVAVWNKMYRKELLEKYHILFDDKIWYGEGMLFNIECLQYTNEVVVGEKSVYHQTCNPDSAMRKFSLKSNFCGIKSLEIQKKIMLKSNDEIENAWRYHRYCFNKTIIDGLVRTKIVSSNRSVYDKCVSDLRKNILLPLKMEKSLKRKLLWCCYFVAPYLMAVRDSYKFKKNIQTARNSFKE